LRNRGVEGRYQGKDGVKALKGSGGCLFGEAKEKKMVVATVRRRKGGNHHCFTLHL
jgi:hypothetical protein